MFFAGWLQPQPRLLGWVLKLGIAGLVAASPVVHSKEPASTSGAVSVAALPGEARTVYRSILAGGPFVYSKDGVVFGNRERRLPIRPHRYYREYTVPTPGARGRGAHRIICGGAAPQTPEVCFYTADHYASFQPIAP